MPTSKHAPNACHNYLISRRLKTKTKQPTLPPKGAIKRQTGPISPNMGPALGPRPVELPNNLQAQRSP